MDQLANATVVIAGASSGIGLATAFAFARCGANLVLGARRGEELRRVAAGCRELGANAIAFELDVGDAKDVQRLTDAAVERFGRIDVWFNNAGVGVVGPFEAAPLDAHVRVIETNLLGVVHGSHAAVRQFMAQDGRGILINMASIGGIFPAPFAASYTASKFAIAGFTDSLRAELAVRSDIQVCGVYPSFVDTPAASYAGNYSGHVLNQYRPHIAPEQVAGGVVDLVRRPRRALFVGGPPLPRLGGGLTSEFVLRRLAVMGQEAVRRAPRAGATTGNLMRPPGEPASLHGQWQPRRDGSERGRALLAAAGVAAAVALVAGIGAAARRSHARGRSRSDLEQALDLACGTSRA